MMDKAAEQDAVETFRFERQMLRVALDKFDVGKFLFRQRDQFRADVEPDRGEAALMQQHGEGAGAAAEIGDARALCKAAKPHHRVDDAPFRRKLENIVVVVGGEAVEERDLFGFVLSLVLSLVLGLVLPRHYRNRGTGSGVTSLPR